VDRVISSARAFGKATLAEQLGMAGQLQDHEMLWRLTIVVDPHSMQLCVASVLEDLTEAL
jgi:hypothetical protein